MQKQEWWIYQKVNKVLRLFSCFATIHECDRQPDRQTARHDIDHTMNIA